MSSFRNLVMLLMTFVIIYSISLLHFSFPPQLHQISLRSCEQVTMDSSTSVFAGGQSSCAWPSPAELLNTIFGLTSFIGPSTIHQPSKDSDDLHLPLCWISCSCLCLHLHSLHLLIWIAPLTPNATHWSGNLNHSMHKMTTQSASEQCHQMSIPQVTKKAARRR